MKCDIRNKRNCEAQQIMLTSHEIDPALLVGVRLLCSLHDSLALMALAPVP